MQAISEGEIIAQFRNALADRGIVPPREVVGDGSFQRADVDAANGKGDASYILHLNGVAAGSICNWQDGAGWQSWKADIGRPLTDSEKASLREKAETDRRLREDAERKRREEMKRKAADLWASTNLAATPEHPYLQRKGVQPRKIKLYRGALVLADKSCDGALMVPLLDERHEVAALQFINDEGDKRYFGPTGGRFFPIGKPRPDAPLLVCEGVATGLSLAQATTYPVVCAMDAGNLGKVGAVMRQLHPNAELIYCADDDARTEGNPGVTKATEAALATGGKIAVPVFGADRGPKDSDFNDVARVSGLEAVRKAVGAAQTPGVPKPQPIAQNAPTAILASAPQVAEAPDASGWPEPQPLPEGLPPVQAFDLDLLPSALRPWIADVCERLQCPPDFVAVAAMVGLGSVVGRRVAIRPQGQTDWEEFPNLWGCIVGRPSVMKSPALEQGLAPLKRLEGRAKKEHDAAMLEYESRARMTKLRREAADAEIKKRLRGNITTDVSDLQVDEPQEPTLRRYITHDTSYESLGIVLGENPNGVQVFRDELVSLWKTLDREDNSGARSFYLTGWAGNSAYTFDRVSRARVTLDAICLSVLGGTQPARLASYIRDAVTGGAGDDGLIQRFGMLVWPDPSPDWVDVDRWPDTEARRAAFDVFDRLDQLDPVTIGAERDTGYDGEPVGQPFLRFDDAALEAFREWRAAWERKLRGGDELPALESHFNKYRKLIPALALLCHLADNAPGRVGLESVVRAIAWGEYLMTHARRAFASLNDPENSAAKAIIHRLRNRDLAPAFNARTLYLKGWAHLNDRKLVHDALALLVDLDWLAREEHGPGPTGGRPATLYIANPRGLRQ